MNTRRLLVIGWDGATWAYIEPLLTEGRLPHLANLLERGTHATLRSTIPPFTNIAWPSLVTGLKPEHTGIFDGAKLAPHTYTRRPTNLVTFRGIPIWRWVNRFEKRAAVFNVPMTCPAQPFDGWLIGGFDTPLDAEEATWPRDLRQRLAAQGRPYTILEREVALMAQQNPHQPRGDLETFAAEWVALTEEQGEFMARFWRDEAPDLLFTVFTATDSINHRTRNRAIIARIYEAADRALGRMLRETDEDTLICLVSDHGSTPAWRYIALYRLLAEHGWLAFRPEVAARFWRRVPLAGQHLARLWPRLPAFVRRLLSWPLIRYDPRLSTGYETIDWSRTQVYALTGMGPLYINLQGRQPAGVVSPADFNRLRAQVRAALLEARDEHGEPLFADVLFGEDVYPDANPQDLPPDLVLIPAKWSDHMITGFPTDPRVRPIPDTREYGTHTPDGIFVLAGPGIVAQSQRLRASIADVVPTLLAAGGIPLPMGLDGQVLHQVLTDEPHITYMPVEAEAEHPDHAPLAADEAILERLRNLGYLE